MLHGVKLAIVIINNLGILDRVHENEDKLLSVSMQAPPGLNSCFIFSDGNHGSFLFNEPDHLTQLDSKMALHFNI